jgi:hypothetical protein
VTDYQARYRATNQRYADLQATPEWQAAVRRFDEAVARCRAIESRCGFGVWAHDVPEEQWPRAYSRAVAEWDAARIARNRLYESHLRGSPVSPLQD